MALKIIQNTVFEKNNYTETALAKGEYEGCRFKVCEFSGSDLSNITFIDCEFADCNLSMTKIKNSAFKTVVFKNCKLLGLNFSDCNSFLLSLGFENCLLNLASFYKLKLKGIKFRNCNLQETDFTETEMTLAVFDNCDLERAIFERTNLEKADFRTSWHYSIDPTVNRIKKARFSKDGLAGLLDKYDIRIE